MRGHDFSQDEDKLAETVRGLRSVAVIGAHTKEHRAAFYVPAYLAAQGVEIHGVNPRFAGQILHDHSVTATAAELVAPVQMVNVFRPSSAIAEHIPDLLAMSPAPEVVWLQLGIRNDEAIQPLLEAGIDVVQDLCLLVVHRQHAGR